MADERLKNMTMIFIESETAKTLGLTELIKIFASVKTRKKSFSTNILNTDMRTKQIANALGCCTVCEISVKWCFVAHIRFFVKINKRSCRRSQKYFDRKLRRARVLEKRNIVSASIKSLVTSPVMRTQRHLSIRKSASLSLTYKWVLCIWITFDVKRIQRRHPWQDRIWI